MRKWSPDRGHSPPALHYVEQDPLDTTGGGGEGREEEEEEEKEKEEEEDEEIQTNCYLAE